MLRLRVALGVGAAIAIGAIGACALDESGTAGDSGGPDVGADVHFDAGDAGDVFIDVPAIDVFLPGCDAGSTCVANVPGGYKIVEYVPTTLTGCTPGYGQQADLIENPTAGTATCSCGCGSSTPTSNPNCACTNNLAAFDVLYGQNCGQANSPTELLADVNCYKMTQAISGNADALIAKPDAGCTATGGACGGSAASSSFTVNAPKTRRCDLNTSNTPPCQAGGICVPNPTNPYVICITDGTMNPCPSNLTTHVVGTNAVDTRACVCTGTCGISSVGTCGNPTLTLYSSNDCTTGGTNLTANGSSCTAGFGNNPSWQSAKYASQNSNAQCGYSGGQYVDGGVSLDSNGAYRICCQP
jgi:hypothetical protein